MSYANARRIPINTAFDMVEDIFSSVKNANYPPYNVVKEDEGKFRVEVVTNGANKKDMTVKVFGDRLVIKYDAPADRDEGVNYIHKGISTKSFNLELKAQEPLKVTSAKVVDGVLMVNVEHDVESHTVTIE